MKHEIVSIDSYFWFCYGEKYDFSESHNFGTEEVINFPSSGEVGYGATLRCGFEVDSFSKYESYTIDFDLSREVNVTFEFVTDTKTCNEKINFIAENHVLTFDISEDQRLKEVKLFISRNDNRDLEIANLTINSWTLTKKS